VSINVLRNLGLSEGEIRIYGALLDLGSASLNRIHESVGIERRNIYDILNKLIEKGLVGYINENKKRFFQVSHPNKIVGYIEEQKHALDETQESVEKELPSLIKKFEFKRPDISAQVYRGNGGIKAVWEDMLNHKAVYWIGSGRYIPKMLPHFFANWNKRRIKLKVRWYNLLRTEMKAEIKEPFPLEECRFLPKEFSVNPAVVCIYGNKVVNFLFTKEFFAFVTENKEIAENYREYHAYLWRISEPL